MKLLLYCTKAKPYLADFKGEYQTFSNGKELDELWDKGFNLNDIMSILNGKIVAECDFEVDKIFEDNFEDVRDGYVEHFYTLESYDDFDEGEKVLLKESCLQKHELSNYFGFEDGYAIHIKNLHIFDEPRDITKLVLINQYRKDLKGTQYNRVKVAPKNMCMVDYAIDCNYKENIFDSPYILISIRPEWLCKILNGEKTIEVRKKVLKEMLNNE